MPTQVMVADNQTGRIVGPQAQAIMDRLLGVQTREAQALPRSEGWHRDFRAIAGVLPDTFFSPRALEAIASSTIVNILMNAVNKRARQDYDLVNYHLDAIAALRGTPDFRPVNFIDVDYFPDTATVDPESADYQEIAAPSDRKITYSLIQKGNLLTVTRKVLVNDDAGVILGKMAGRLGRTAARTHAKYVWNFFSSNATYTVDSVAWFHASHSNLQSTALTGDATGATQVLTAETALANQTEPGSGEKLGVPPDENLRLIVPVALWTVARTLNGTPSLPTYGMFGARGERIACIPFLSDATDWGLSRVDVPSLEISYLQDERTPRVTIADMPTLPQQLLSEKLQFKVWHEFGVGLIDFRGAVKAVVAG